MSRSSRRVEIIKNPQPKPRKAIPSKWRFDEIKVGEGFEFTHKQRNSVASAASRYKALTGKVFECSGGVCKRVS